MALLVSIPASAEDISPRQSAFQPKKAIKKPDLAVLSTEDIALYQKIFALQESGRWKKADKLIKQVSDDILMGHVQFQRYMHPTKYRSKYTELRRWMADYADHPEAKRVYRLAMHRKPRKSRAPAKPTPRNYDNPLAVVVAGPPPAISKEQQKINRLGYSVRSRISKYLRRGKVEKAEKRIWAAENAGVFDELAFDTQLSRVASAYYYKGNIEKALAIGSIAAERSIDQLPEASWIAGLAAWKQQEWAVAADLFTAVWASPESNSWLRSAGAYWAARSYMKSRQPDMVSDMLAKASKEKRTFYGLLALRQSGETPNFDWDAPEAALEHVELALSTDGIRRAVALWQIDNLEEADREFRVAHRRMPPGSDHSLLPTAMEMGLHGATAKLARRIINQDDIAIDAGLYPLPDWAPSDGYKLDRAFLFAVMRQESAFNPTAVSYAGASGLMQLMPATAAYIQRDNSLRKKNRKKLYDPAFNMMLGQKYLQYLLNKPVTSGNIMLVIAGYNAGPGNIAKWKQRTNHGDDWLLFMESIPNRQNRNYVERVMANLWVYRQRFGQATPSLDQIAGGHWPRYASLDGRPLPRSAALSPSAFTESASE
jgi:soluble lytic murein transglycosylase